MKNFTANAVMFACGSLLLTASNSFAQTNTKSSSESHEVHPEVAGDDSKLEHVLVSVPVHKQASKTALPVTVLSGDELRASAMSTIGDTLANKPGLANASFGPGVGQPVIRGQQGPRVSVLQNSLSSSDASNVSADHAVSVEPLLADSIEVLRGPSTLLYGGGAIGGVVNVIDNRIPTKQVDGVTGGVEYRHEGAADQDVSAFRIDAGQGDFALHIDGLYRDWNDQDVPGKAIDEQAVESGHADHDDHEEEELENTDGFVPNTDGRTKALTVGGSMFFEGGLFGLSVSRLENNYGIPPAGHASHGHDDHDDEHGDEDHDESEEAHGEEGIRIDVEQTRYDSRLELEDPFSGIHQLKWLLSYTDYEHSEIEPNGAVGTRFENDTWESRLELAHEPLLGWHGVVGLQLKQGDFSAIGEESFIPETESRSLGLFVVEGYDWRDWTFELGARVDQDERSPSDSSAKDESFTSLSASASALWQINDAWQLSLALSRAERAPVTEELFSNVDAPEHEEHEEGGDHGDEHDEHEGEHEREYVVHGATQAIEVGNTNLDTEKSMNGDIKLSWQGASARAEATLFYNNFSDYIYLENSGEFQDEVPVLHYEQQDAKFYGVEFEAGWTVLASGSSTLDLTLFGDSIRGEFDDNADVPRLPPLRVGGRVDYRVGDWSSYVSVINAADQDKPGLNETETDGYTRWDLGMDYRLPGLKPEHSALAFLKVNNVTDEEIRLSTSFLRNYAPEAGRSIIGGIRYQF